jgi:hypothetical protein
MRRSIRKNLYSIGLLLGCFGVLLISVAICTFILTALFNVKNLEGLFGYSMISGVLLTFVGFTTLVLVDN